MNVVAVAIIFGEAGKLAKLCTVAVETTFVAVDGKLDCAVAVNRIYHFQ